MVGCSDDGPPGIWAMYCGLSIGPPATVLGLYITREARQVSRPKTRQSGCTAPTGGGKCVGPLHQNPRAFAPARGEFDGLAGVSLGVILFCDTFILWFYAWPFLAFYLPPGEPCSLRHTAGSTVCCVRESPGQGASTFVPGSYDRS